MGVGARNWGGADGVQVVYRPNPRDVPEITRKQRLLLGQPHCPLPPDIPRHKVLGVVAGMKVRADVVEMIFCDYLLAAFVYSHCADFDYNRQSLPSELEVLKLARELYGERGRWLEAHYGKTCLVCFSNMMPDHASGCAAAQRAAANLQRVNAANQ